MKRDLREVFEPKDLRSAIAHAHAIGIHDILRGSLVDAAALFPAHAATQVRRLYARLARKAARTWQRAYCVRAHDRKGKQRHILVITDRMRKPRAVIDLEDTAPMSEMVQTGEDNAMRFVDAPGIFDREILYPLQTALTSFDLRLEEVRDELATEPVWTIVFTMMKQMSQDRRRRITHAAASLKEGRDGIVRIVVYLGELNEDQNITVIQSLSMNREMCLPGDAWS